MPIKARKILHGVTPSDTTARHGMDEVIRSIRALAESALPDDADLIKECGIPDNYHAAARQLAECVTRRALLSAVLLHLDRKHV